MFMFMHYLLFVFKVFLFPNKSVQQSKFTTTDTRDGALTTFPAITTMAQKIKSNL